MSHINLIGEIMKTFIRLPAVREATGLSTSTIYEGIRDGWFPKPVKMGPRAIAWDIDVISAWQDERIAKSA